MVKGGPVGIEESAMISLGVTEHRLHGGATHGLPARPRQEASQR